MPASLIANPNAERRVFGSGEIFFNGVYVGEGNNVVFAYVEESVYQYTGRPRNKSSKALKQQDATLTFQAAEFATSNVRQALNQYETKVGHVFHEIGGVVVQLTGVVAASLGKTNICKEDGTAAAEADITVSPVNDISSPYATTDFTLDEVTGTVVRTALSTIPSGAYVRVFFSWNDATAEVTEVGGKSSCLAVTEAELKFVYQFENCDPLEITFFRASPSGGLNITFDSENFVTRDLVFEALADLSRPPGRRLWSVAMPAAA